MAGDLPPTCALPNFFWGFSGQDFCGTKTVEQLRAGDPALCNLRINDAGEQDQPRSAAERASYLAAVDLLAASELRCLSVDWSSIAFFFRRSGGEEDLSRLAAALGRLLAKTETITHLFFDGSLPADEDWPSLEAGLCANTTLTHLVIDLYSGAEKRQQCMAAALGNMLAENRTLRYLRGVAHLGPGVAKNTSLRMLDLTHVEGEQGAELLRSLQTTQLTELCVSSVAGAARGALAALLETHRGLERFECNNYQGRAGLVIGPALAKAGLQHLILDNWDSEEGIALATGLRANSTLRSLILGCGSLPVDGAVAVCDAAASHSCLEHLNFSDGLPAAVAAVLARCIEQSAALRRLRLCPESRPPCPPSPRSLQDGAEPAAADPVAAEPAPLWPALGRGALTALEVDRIGSDDDETPASAACGDALAAAAPALETLRCPLLPDAQATALCGRLGGKLMQLELPQQTLGSEAAAALAAALPGSTLRSLVLRSLGPAGGAAVGRALASARLEALELREFPAAAAAFAAELKDCRLQRLQIGEAREGCYVHPEAALALFGALAGNTSLALLSLEVPDSRDLPPLAAAEPEAGGALPSPLVQQSAAALEAMLRSKTALQTLQLFVRDSREVGEAIEQDRVAYTAAASRGLATNRSLRACYLPLGKVTTLSTENLGTSYLQSVLAASRALCESLATNICLTELVLCGVYSRPMEYQRHPTSAETLRLVQREHTAPQHWVTEALRRVQRNRALRNAHVEVARVVRCGEAAGLRSVVDALTAAGFERRILRNLLP